MTIKGTVGSFSRKEERAQIPGHEPVILSGKLKANDGVYPVGLILTRKAGDLIPFAEVSDEVIGTGNGATQVFAATLASFPVEPGTVSVSDGVETFADDSVGRLVGSAGGTGTIDYTTGKISLDFNANVVNAVNVLVDYTTAVGGVLDEETDTANSGSCIYVAHGTVATVMLKVGKTAPAEPSGATLMLLQKHGIYPK